MNRKVSIICLSSSAAFLVACGGGNYEGETRAQLMSGPPELPIEILDEDRLSGTNLHTLALATNGSVFAWGANNVGQLGNNSALNFSAIPVRVIGLSAVTQVQTGEGHSVALHNDGHLWAWGSNAQGQLGMSQVMATSVPMKLTAIDSVKAVAAGQNHTVALKSNGSLWGWGKTATSYANLPQSINITDVKSLAAGTDFTLALKHDGTVWAWGVNESGQLGNQSFENSSSPVQVVGLAQVKAISAGFSHALALLNDGTVKSWGKNGNGQLGNGNRNNSNTPTSVFGLTQIKAVSAGAKNGMALKADGSVYTWGSTLNGQIGSGPSTAPFQLKPLKVGGIVNAVSISSGNGFSSVILKNGQVMTFGFNGSGQLGNKTKVSSDKPVRVIGLSGTQTLDVGSRTTGLSGIQTVNGGN
ncbi:hypothetical protein H8K33_16965 [Undibacterium amnicola]|uniref:RCC1-like domain-containing protein n=1 Tax=Undibacterium amnicola TaxID=1834038 RepID=A0ABR6XUP2_9BURK|nr:hypothetical protein [Undibacterium amnicola]MBC3833203.1 hypothetical protein [Undibacterium amnicola]